MCGSDSARPSSAQNSLLRGENVMLDRRSGYRALSLAALVIAPLALDPGSAAVAGGGRGSGTGGYFFGMLHQPLGGAALGTDPAGRLVVSNIGSSGQDGVSVTFSEPSPPSGVTPGWAGEIDFGPAGSLSTGTYIRVRAGALGLGPVAGFRVAEVNGGHAAVSFEQALCPTCDMTVQLLRHNAVVSSATYPSSFTDTLVTGNIGTTPAGGVPFLIGGRKADDDVIDFTLMVLNPQLLNLAGLPPVETDAVVVRLNGLPPGTRYIGNLTVTASDTGPITVQTEGLLKSASTGKVKFFNEAKGFGYITGGGDLDGDGLADIVVSNIGSSGQDGVSLVRFRASTPGTIENTLSSIAVEADWGDAGALPPGSSMKFIVGNDAPVVRTYALTVTETGGGHAAVSVIPCNEPGCCEPCCPCAGVVVEAVRNGVLVDRVVHAALPQIVAVGNIGSSGNDGVTFFASLIDSCLNLTEDRYLLGLRQHDPAPITLTGSSIGPVTADSVRVRITPADDLGSLVSARLLASSVSSFAILNGEERREFVTDLTHDGLPHMALGGANLAVTADGSLQIHGDWDADGIDTVGVAIRMGEADGWAGEVDFGPAGALQASSRAVVKLVIRSTNEQRLDISETSGGQAAISFEQDYCPTCPLKVELLLDGQVVSSATYPPPYPPQLVTGNIGSSGNDGVKIVLDRDSGRSRLINPFPTSMRLFGPVAPVNAESVRMTLTGLPAGPMADGIIEVAIASEGIPDVDFRVAEERTLNDYNIADSGPCPNIALGGATMCASRDNHLQGAADIVQALHVSNIGSSGNDGVRIDPPDDDCDGIADPANRIGVAYDGLIIPANGKHAINTKGTGAQGGLAGTTAFDVFLEIEGIDGLTQSITADFTSLGATTHTVQVYNDGVLAGSHSGVASLVATIPSGHALHSLDATRSSDDEVVKTFTWTQTGGPFAFTIPGHPPVLGDQLRVTPENATVQVAAITSMSLTGRDLGAFTIVGETIVLLNTCPADVAPAGAPDHSVDVNDLLAVITSWGPCVGCPPVHCAADIAPPSAGDCQVNVNDLLLVITTWGACP